jgi:hypothetical protein
VRVSALRRALGLHDSWNVPQLRARNGLAILPLYLTQLSREAFRRGRGLHARLYGRGSRAQWRGRGLHPRWLGHGPGLHYQECGRGSRVQWRGRGLCFR